MKNFVEELRWRGMIHDLTPETEEYMLKNPTAGYVGIDPTADSLHIGHLVGVMMLKHLQMCGHKPIALVGGATGMIGDPSGKSQERNLLTEESLRQNENGLKKQLAKFLDFDNDQPNAAILVNNYDWMKTFSFLEFIREVNPACRLPNSATSWYKDTTFCTFFNIMTAICKWEDPISGEISPPVPNLSAVNWAPTRKRLLSPVR